MQNGRFLYKTAFGLADLDTRAPLTSATAFNVASMSKQFTAATLYFLVESGKVRLADPNPPLHPRAAQVRRCHYGRRPGSSHQRPARFRTVARSGRTQRRASRYRGQSEVAGAPERALNFAPGADYEYTNSDYLLLSAIVERVTGMTLAAFAEERLFGPLRMGNTQFYGQAQKLRDRASGYVERGARYRRIQQPLMSGAGGLFTSPSKTCCIGTTTSTAPWSAAPRS